LESKQTRKIRIILFAICILIDLAVLYALALSYPQPFFHYRVQYQNLTLYSDKPLPAISTGLLKKAQTRLLKSTIYDPKTPYQIFICHDLNRFTFFANTNYRVGGMNYALFNRNTFLRNAHIAKNRLIGPSGREVPGERSLVYFIAHEVSHGITAKKIGNLAYFRLPVWIREGYADYVAKGHFDFQTNLKQFKAGVREMNPTQSGLYLRYHLLVAYVLDIQKASVRELLQGKFNQSSIEATLRRLKTGSNY
jgi:hypothetical protein